MIFVLCLCITLFLCSAPTGVILLTWIYDINPQDHGSKNIGMSNVWRIKGATAGLITLAGDMLKSYLALYIAQTMGVTMLQPLAIVAVFAHCYSIYLAGRGGKGVATAGGVLLFFAPYLCIVLAFAWFLVRMATNKASMASIATSILSVLLCWWLYAELSLLVLLLFLIIAWRHKENWRKLRDKTELSAQAPSNDPL